MKYIQHCDMQYYLVQEILHLHMENFFFLCSLQICKSRSLAWIRRDIFYQYWSRRIGWMYQCVTVCLRCFGTIIKWKSKAHFLTLYFFFIFFAFTQNSNILKMFKYLTSHHNPSVFKWTFNHITGTSFLR